MNSVPHSRRRHSLALIPRSVWALGFVSLLMDVSSEMIHALLPLYMVSVLGTSVLAVGLIKPIAQDRGAGIAISILPYPVLIQRQRCLRYLCSSSSRVGSSRSAASRDTLNPSSLRLAR